MECLFFLCETVPECSHARNPLTSRVLPFRVIQITQGGVSLSVVRDCPFKTPCLNMNYSMWGVLWPSGLTRKSWCGLSRGLCDECLVALHWGYSGATAHGLTYYGITRPVDSLSHQPHRQP